MRKIIKRMVQWDLPEGKSAFLWGPRQVGKSYWINHTLRPAALIDLLKTDVFAEYASRPALLRERFHHHRGLIVIDEIQKIPALLDEIHWLIENGEPSFLMTGSSARKLRRDHANLLAGRARRKIMVPLSIMEVEGFDLERAMTSGLLPPHFLASEPLEDLRAYIADYLKEEVAAEARVRNIPAFTEFLRVAAVTSSELLNYANVAREAGISSRIVRTYFDILDDSYLGFRVPPWTRSNNRRMILTEKFYFFDVGVANFLARRQPRPGSPEFGKSFEHYLLMELRAYQTYRCPDLPIAFWRTAAGQEVDFILGEKDLVVEIKGSPRVQPRDIASLTVLREDGPVRKTVVVSMEREPRTVAGDIEILPWRLFLERLWSGEYL